MAREVRIGSARVDYTAKDAGFSRATKRVNRQLTGFEKKAAIAKGAAGRLSASIGGLAAGFIGVSAAIGGARWLGNFVEQNAKLASNLLQTSRLVGLTTDELQIIRKAMGEFDIKTETTTKALKKFTQSVYDGRRGLATQKEAFEALGITMDDLNNLSTWELLDRVGEGMRTVTDTTKKSGAAMALFGQRSVAVADGLGKIDLKSKEYVDSIRKTGIATSLELRALQDYIKGTDEMSDIMETKGLSAAAKLAKGLLDIKRSYTELKIAFAESFLPDFVREALLIAADVLDRLDGTSERSRSKFAQSADAADFERSITRFSNIAAGERQILDEYIADRDAKLEKLASVPAGSRSAIYIRNQLGEINDKIFDANERLKIALDDRKVIEQNYFKWQQENGLFVGPIRPEGAAAAAPAPVLDNVIPPAEDENKAKEAGKKWTLNYITGLRFAFAQNESALRSEFENTAILAGKISADSIRDSEVERFARTGRNERFAQQLAEAESGIIKLSDETKNRLEPVIAGLNSRFESFFTSIIDGTADAGDAFKNLASQIAQAVFQAIVLQPLINSITGGIGSALGIPARASGGPVTGGNPYIVGERGPELFVPAMSGDIIPNSRMGGKSVTIQQSFNIQSTDGPGVRKALSEAMPVFRQVALDDAANAFQRPTGFE